MPQVGGHPVRASEGLVLDRLVRGHRLQGVLFQGVVALSHAVRLGAPGHDTVERSVPLELGAGGEQVRHLGGIGEDEDAGAGGRKCRGSHFGRLLLGDTIGRDHEGPVTEGVGTEPKVAVEVALVNELPVGKRLGRGGFTLQQHRLTEQGLPQLNLREIVVQEAQPIHELREPLLDLEVLVGRELGLDQVEPLVGERDIAPLPGAVGGTPVGGRVDVLQVHPQELRVLRLDAGPLILTGQGVDRALLDVGQERVGGLDLELLRHARQGRGGKSESQQQQAQRLQGGKAEQFVQVQHGACPRGDESKFGIRGIVECA